jgi:hypothetical protein
MTSYAQSEARAGAAEGWAMFAGIMLCVVGASNIIFGLTAIFNDEVLTKTGGVLIFWDFTTWGWIQLLGGAIMLAAAFGLFAGQSWAAIVAVIFATLNAISQVSWITVSPIWSLIVISLDVIVIYQLTARWTPSNTT